MNRRSVTVVLGLFLVAGLAAGQITIYGVTGQGGAASTLYSVNASTGAATSIGATGFSGVGSLATNPGGVLYGVSGNTGGAGGLRQLITINTSTGAGTVVGATGIPDNLTDIAFRSDGALFAMTGAGGLYSINTSTGAAALINAGTGISGGGLAFNSAGTLFLANGSTLQTVNTSTGARTNVAAFTFPGTTDTVVGMKFSSSGVLYGAAWSLDSGTPSQLVTINTGTAVITSIGSNGVRLEAIAVTGTGTAPPPTTPIPSTLLLMGTGILALAGWRYWRRRAAA